MLSNDESELPFLDFQTESKLKITNNVFYNNNI